MRFHGIIDVSDSARFPGVKGDHGHLLQLPVVGRRVKKGRYLVTGDILMVDGERSLHLITALPTRLSPCARVQTEVVRGIVPNVDVPVSGHQDLSGEIEGALLALNGKLVLGDVTVAENEDAVEDDEDDEEPAQPPAPPSPPAPPAPPTPPAPPESPASPPEDRINAAPSIPAEIQIPIQQDEEFPQVDEPCFAFPGEQVQPEPEPEPESHVEPQSDQPASPGVEPRGQAQRSKGGRPPREPRSQSDEQPPRTDPPKKPQKDSEKKDSGNVISDDDLEGRIS